MNAQNLEVVSTVPDLMLTSKSSEHEFALGLQQRIPKVHCVGDTWYAYKAGVWEKISPDLFLPAAMAILPPECRTARAAACLIQHIQALHQVHPDFFAGGVKFDAEGRVLVNCLNGVVRCSPGAFPELLPHGPEHRFCAQVQARWDINAEARVFRDTLTQVLPDDADQNLFRICAGNILYPDSRFEVCVVCYGESGTSKSTLCEPFAKVLGSALATSLSMAQLCDPKSYNLPDLRYAALNMATELDAIELEDSSMFKRIVSGERIPARAIYGAPFDMTPAVKLWFLSNNLPRFKHGTEAELRRTRMLKFSRVPGRVDVTLKARVAADVDGVFLFMLEGLVELMSLQTIPQGGADSRGVLDRFRICNDPIGAFLTTRCRLGAGEKVGKDVLFEAFTEFCEDNGFSDMFRDMFLRKLLERCSGVHSARLRGSNGSRTHTLVGIGLVDVA